MQLTPIEGRRPSYSHADQSSLGNNMAYFCLGMPIWSPVLAWDLEILPSDWLIISMQACDWSKEGPIPIWTPILAWGLSNQGL